MSEHDEEVRWFAETLTVRLVSEAVKLPEADSYPDLRDALKAWIDSKSAAADMKD